MTNWIITAVAPNGEDREKEIEGTRADAEGKVDDLEGLGFTDISIRPADDPATSETVEVVEESPAPNDKQEETTDALDKLGESIENDPLDVLPGYMITTVEGKPSLNKRGVSVLAYHYDIDVTDHDVVAYPHETEYESAMVTITVTNASGRTFVGSGEAHKDETPKHQLLRMAETRAYKRAVIFATGTGIVGYQELMEELD